MNSEQYQMELLLCKKPRMVITDSQVFKKVAEIVPGDVLLTSFSMLFARYKGELWELVAGARAIDKLKDGDKVLEEGTDYEVEYLCGDVSASEIVDAGEYTVIIKGINNYSGVKVVKFKIKPYEL